MKQQHSLKKEKFKTTYFLSNPTKAEEWDYVSCEPVNTDFYYKTYFLMGDRYDEPTQK